MERLADLPEEEIWLAKQKSARTRRAYKLDLQHLIATIKITETGELRQVDHRVVIAWERHMREVDKAAPSTIRRRMSPLSSLFPHLVRHGHAAKNPVTEIDRPAINREEGTTLAFAKQDARKLPDLPKPQTKEGAPDVEGLRDRAILSTGLQGGRREALAIHPQAAGRIRDYLTAAGHADDMDGSLLRPLHHNGHATPRRRAMDPDAIDRVLRKYATPLGFARGYPARSVRATFITTALDNGAALEDVQKAAGHRDASTTKLYDRRGYNHEKVVSYLANY